MKLRSGGKDLEPYIAELPPSLSGSISASTAADPWHTLLQVECALRDRSADAHWPLGINLIKLSANVINVRLPRYGAVIAINFEESMMWTASSEARE